METQKEELVRKTRAKIIELFGPESALAQAMEDEDFFDKLGQLIAWLYGEIMLTLPRPEPHREPYPYKPKPVAPEPRPPGWDNWATAAPITKWFANYARSMLSSSHDYKANV